ncbi:MAG: helix-turn-helix domain-containing protein [Nitrospirota bacterium]|jgi:excisionase family DNA binding protein
MVKEIMTAKQVAEYLQMDERTVYKLARSRMVPSMKVLGQWRFKRRLIDEWIEKGCSKNNKKR